MKIFHTNNQVLLNRLNNLNEKITQNNIIHKNISNSNTRNSLIDINIPDWEEKVNNHMNYKNGNL